MAAATTGDTSMAQLVPYYVDKRTLERLIQKTSYRESADVKPLPANSGKTVYWNRWNNLGVGWEIVEGTLTGASALSATRVSATVTQLVYNTNFTDLLDMTIISPILNDVSDLLADGMARTVDQYISNLVCFSAGTSSGVADAASTHVLSARTNGFPIQSNSRITFGSVPMLITTFSAALNVARVVEAATHLRALGAQEFDDGFFRGHIHPTVATRLMSDSSWTYWNANGGRTDETMARGQIGTVGGVKFMMNANAQKITSKASAWSAGQCSAGGTLYGTLVVGKNAFGFTEITGHGMKVNIIPPDKVDKYDPVGQLGFANIKVTCAAKILNPSAGIILGDYVEA